MKNNRKMLLPDPVLRFDPFHLIRIRFMEKTDPDPTLIEEILTFFLNLFSSDNPAYDLLLYKY